MSPPCHCRLHVEKKGLWNFLTGMIALIQTTISEASERRCRSSLVKMLFHLPKNIICVVGFLMKGYFSFRIHSGKTSLFGFMEHNGPLSIYVSRRILKTRMLINNLCPSNCKNNRVRFIQCDPGILCGRLCSRSASNQMPWSEWVKCCSSWVEYVRVWQIWEQFICNH